MAHFRDRSRAVGRLLFRITSTVTEFIVQVARSLTILQKANLH